MPIESALLRDASAPFDSCPNCYALPFDQFMRGQVQRGIFGMMWAYLRGAPDWRHYCAVICWDCKEIVGYE